MAVNDPTTNFGWNLPTDQGDSGVWGTLLNSIFGEDAGGSPGIDKVVNDIKTTADAALPKAGGVLTGQVENKTDRYVTVDKGSISGAQSLDYGAANYFFATVTGAVTWTFSNPPASGKWGAMFLELTNGGAGAQTWPASVDWPGGSAPTLVISGVDLLMFTTRDGGTIWHGSLTNADSK